MSPPYSGLKSKLFASCFMLVPWLLFHLEDLSDIFLLLIFNRLSIYGSAVVLVGP
jgi:hypothetical protein